MAAEDGASSGLEEDSRAELQEQQELRPSFTEFWRRNKELHDGRDIKFVKSQGAGSTGDDEGSGAGSEAQIKAKARRDQVRKAQRQHRQRKANYTKELEVDVARLRDLILQAEAEARAIKMENDAIRHDISTPAVVSGGLNFSLPKPATTIFNFDLPLVPTVSEYNAAKNPEYTVRVKVDDLMQTPTFNVTRASNAQSGSQNMNTPTSNSNSGTGTDILRLGASPESLAGDMTDDQTDLVVNFILALEHVCWDHFRRSHYAHGSYDPLGSEHGHSLMASSIALQHAPTAVFDRLDAVQSSLRADPHCRPPTEDMAWRSAGLTLESLYDLANTLNPPDRELAPVQAWFEIVREYGPEVALDAAVLDCLKREFRGVVKCLHFGAVIERDAFDSIVGRVVGARWEGLEDDVMGPVVSKEQSA